MSASSKLKRFRRATPDDADSIIDLIVEINRKVGAVYGIPMEAESVIQTVMHTIKRGICLVGDGACAGGLIHPYVWNRSASVGLIVFWNYSRPSGIHIFEAMIQAFRQHGATHLNCSSHFPANRIGQHYVKRFDMAPVEVQYLAEISKMRPQPTAANAQEVACLH